MENIVTDSREDVYCVFIFHPNCVDEYAIINTPHSQIIKFIKFCPSGLGNFILLCDGVQKITLWKMMVYKLFF